MWIRERKELNRVLLSGRRYKFGNRICFKDKSILFYYLYVIGLTKSSLWSQSTWRSISLLHFHSWKHIFIWCLRSWCQTVCWIKLYKNEIINMNKSYITLIIYLIFFYYILYLLFLFFQSIYYEAWRSSCKETRWKYR